MGLAEKPGGVLLRVAGRADRPPRRNRFTDRLAEIDFRKSSKERHRAEAAQGSIESQAMIRSDFVSTLTSYVGPLNESWST